MRALFTATLATLAVAAIAHAGEAQTIVHWSTFMRAGPGSNFGTIDEIDGGEAVGLVGCDKDWCAVRYSGRVGYIMADALNLVPLPRRGKAPADAASCFEANGVGWSRPVPQRFCGSQP